MKRNLLLVLAILVIIVLAVNGVRRILNLRTTSQKVRESQEQLEKLKQENEALKRESEYKKSQEFAEAEIRNKLGLAKEGETVVVLPESDGEQSSVSSEQSTNIANYIKWWRFFFGS